MSSIRIINIDCFIAALEQHGISVYYNAPLPNGYGEKFTLRNGGILTIYPSTYNWQIQGKMLPKARASLEALMQQLLPKAAVCRHRQSSPRFSQAVPPQEGDWTEEEEGQCARILKLGKF
ncbi:MAG: hypothetical protein JWQ21_585 [Herminiimonas sp.]|nr:hypothetical protein [Herminiimonas sp.]